MREIRILEKDGLNFCLEFKTFLEFKTWFARFEIFRYFFISVIIAGLLFFCKKEKKSEKLKKSFHLFFFNNQKQLQGVQHERSSIKKKIKFRRGLWNSFEINSFSKTLLTKLEI